MALLQAEQKSASRLPHAKRSVLRRPVAVAVALGLLLPLAACDLQYAIMGFSEPNVQVAAKGAPVELPFREGPGGLVLITGKINGGGSYDFILDTGAPVSVILDGPGTEALKLDTSKARKLGDPDNPATPTGVITPGFSFEFGAVKFSDLTAVVIPRKVMPCAERFNALNFQGVIGADLFKRFVVEIDHERKRVRLHDPAQVPAALAAQLGTARAAELPLTFRNGHIYTDLKVRLAESDVPVHVHVDTGKNGTLSLITASKPEIKAPANGTVQESCYVNGTAKSLRGDPVTLRLADTVARDVPVTYEANDQVKLGKRQGAIGITLLKRYVTWIDYPGKRMVLVERQRGAATLFAGPDAASEYSLGAQRVLNAPPPPMPPMPPASAAPPAPPEVPPVPATPSPATASDSVAVPPMPPMPPLPPVPAPPPSSAQAANPPAPPAPPQPAALVSAPTPPAPPSPPRMPEPPTSPPLT